MSAGAERRLELAYAGSFGPEGSGAGSAAFSPAGHRWQHGLLAGLAAAGLPPSLGVGFPPFPAFPRGPAVVRAAGAVPGRAEERTRFLGYLNLPLVKVPWIGMRAARELRRWARGRRGEKVLLVYNVSVPPVWLLAATARRLGVAVVASLNDVWVPGGILPDTAARRLDYLLQRRGMRALTGALVVSAATARELLPGTPWLLVEGGVFAEQVGVGLGESREERPFTLGFAGSLVPYNGVREVLAAAPALAAAGVRLRVAGSGPLAGEVRAAAASCEAIEYLGALPLERMPELFRGCDLLVNWRTQPTPDLRFFFPSKLLELLASGVPVLTTPFGGLGALAGYALVAGGERPEDLVAGVGRALRSEHRELAALGARAAAHMAGRYDWAVQGARVREFLCGLSTAGRERLRP